MGFKLPNGSDLSEEQLDTINLVTTRDWLIKGAPGTGKTVMAIYRAKQVSQTSKGKPVLILVYNNPLMRFLSTAVQGKKDKNLSVSTYHQWINTIYNEYRLGTVPKDGFNYDWNQIKKDLKVIGKKYYHIVIDEAQDFPIELLQIIKSTAEHITCFIDPNQAIEIGKTNILEAWKALCNQSPYTLKKNFRNTKPIRDLSALYCRDGDPAPSDEPGKKPVAIKCISGDFDDLNQKMIEIIKKNKEKNIGIIVNPKALNSTFESLKKTLSKDIIVQMYKPMTQNKIDFDKNGVKILSYGTMKGLEFDMVLLPMFDKIEMKDGGIVDMNRIYVAVSRPISELYLFYWSEKPSAGKINTMDQLTSHKNLLEWK